MRLSAPPTFARLILVPALPLLARTHPDLELEVVLRDGEAAAAGIDEAHALMARLGVPTANLVASAYVDLLNAQANHAPRPAG